MANNPADAFLNTTQVWNLPDPAKDTSNFLTQLYYALNSISLLLNIKDTGQYSPQEFTCGQQYVFNQNPNQVIRKVIDFGALPNTAAKSVAHGIGTAGAGGTIKDYTFTRIYGASSDPTNRLFIPLPYASTTLANGVELSLSDTNVVVTTGIDRSAFTKTYIVIEWFKF